MSRKKHYGLDDRIVSSIIPRDIEQRLQARARRQGRSLCAVIREALVSSASDDRGAE